MKIARALTAILAAFVVALGVGIAIPIPAGAITAQAITLCTYTVKEGGADVHRRGGGIIKHKPGGSIVTSPWPCGRSDNNGFTPVNLAEGGIGYMVIYRLKNPR